MYVSAETERWSVRIESRIVYAHLIYHIIYCFRVIYSIEREWRESTSESTLPVGRFGEHGELSVTPVERTSVGDDTCEGRKKGER
jgi:hypothetical protein